MVEHMIQFLTEYGYMLLLAWVLAEQFGFPLPAAPVLLAAGALAGRGVLQLGTALAVGVTACMLSDSFWFHMGRRGGGKVLNFICRISLEPDSCVRRTSNTIGKYGPKSLLVTKFVPGIVADRRAWFVGLLAGDLATRSRLGDQRCHHRRGRPRLSPRQGAER